MKKERFYIDWRKNPHWEELLGEMVDSQVFYEGRQPPQNMATLNRLQLSVGENLVLYSLPSSPQLGKELLARVSPLRVYLIFCPETEFSGRQFLEILLGMVKFDLANKGGRGNLLEMAITLGQRIETIQLGLDYLVAKGLIEYRLEELWQVVFSLGTRKPQVGLREAERRVRVLLEETKAFHRYLAKCPLAQIRDYFD